MIFSEIFLRRGKMFDKKEFVSICSNLYQKKLIGGYGGNISVRDNDLLLITPTGVNKGILKEEDLLIVDFNGKVVEGKGEPSSEILMHFETYKKREDIKAIIHSHPPFCVSLSLSGTKLPDNILPETTIHLGTIAFVPYIPPGTMELAKGVSNGFEGGDAVIMGNHGVTVVGKNLLDAYNKIELVEETAKAYIFSKIIGKTNLLPEIDSKVLLDMYKKMR